MSEILNLDVIIKEDPQLLRPNENKKIIGSYQKIKSALGWQPEIPLEKSLADIIEYWQQKMNCKGIVVLRANRILLSTINTVPLNIHIP